MTASTSTESLGAPSAIVDIGCRSAQPPALLLALSADDPQTLAARIEAVRAGAAQATTWHALRSLCLQYAATEPGSHRIALTARHPAALATQLRAAVPPPAIEAGPRPRLVFVCPGQGAQWIGMARSLMAQEPVFRSELVACDRHVRALLGWSLLDALLANEDAPRTENVHVLLFSFQCALAALLRAWGVYPDAVLGLRLGEVSAAYIAGVLSLRDALSVVVHGTQRPTRGRLAVHRGDAAHPDELAATCVRSGDMQPLRELTPRVATTSFWSTARRGWLRGAECDAGYWRDHLRHAVPFSEAVAAVEREGPCVFIELGPHAVLAQASSSPSTILPTCVRHADERASLLECLAGLFRLGFTPHFARALSPAGTLEPDRRGADAAWPLLLSSRSRQGLAVQAARLHERLVAAPELPRLDVAYTLACARPQLEHRACLSAADRPGLVRALAALARGEEPPAGSQLLAAEPGGVGKLAFLFSGEGSQRIGMGRELYAQLPVFRDAFDAVCSRFERELGVPLPGVIWAAVGSPKAALLAQTAFAQPALFALEVALFRVFEACGVRADRLLGHSLGEISAAHVAGVLDLDDASKLVAARARLVQALPRGGAMVAVEAAELEVRALLAGREARVDLAAVDGPAACVLSGDEEAVLALAQELAARGCKTTRLPTRHALHSPRMDGMLESFRQVASQLAFRAPRIAIVSNVTGALAQPEELASAAYWTQHVRRSVSFYAGLRTLQASGVTTLLELGPHGALCALASSALPNGPFAQPVLARDRPELETLACALGSLHVRGHAVTWPALLEPFHARRVELPRPCT